MPYYLTTMNGEDRLIKAATIAGARNHIVKPLVPELKMLDVDGVADAMSRGLAIEDAGAADAEPAKDGDK